MKKKLTVLSILALCFAFTLSSTLAYFSTEEKAHNVITTGGVEIDLIEKMWDENGKLVDYEYVEDNPLGVLPGRNVSKIVEVKNTGASSAWVRVKIEKTIDLEGEQDNESADKKLVKLNFRNWEKDETNWTKKGEYWYYGKALEPGETTVPLLESVTFNGPEMGNLYQNSKIDIDITAEAVQTANNGKSALEALGWTED